MHYAGQALPINQPTVQASRLVSSLTLPIKLAFTPSHPSLFGSESEDVHVQSNLEIDFPMDCRVRPRNRDILRPRFRDPSCRCSGQPRPSEPECAGHVAFTPHHRRGVKSETELYTDGFISTGL